MPAPRDLIDRLIEESVVDETIAIDFKRDAYSRETRLDLIKDVMALANAQGASTRLIIIGVYSPVDAPREWRPLDPSKFEDDANLQQVVHECVEPIVPFSYRRHYIDSGDHAGLYGVLEIEGALSPPYMGAAPFARHGQAAKG